MCRRDGHLVLGREEQPNADANDHAQVAVHEQFGFPFEALVICDPLANGIGYATTSKERAEELEDHSEEACLLDGQRLGADISRIPARAPTQLTNIPGSRHVAC